MTDADVTWIDPANADQLRAWDTAEGVFWAAEAELFERALARYDDHLFRALAIRDGDRVLDLGCGSGSTTRAAARLAGSGSAYGVDLSSPLLAVARRLAEEVPNVQFEQADAQVARFPADTFDGVLSRTGCMFFGDPRAAFRNVAQAMRPDGRLALLVWRTPDRNEWFTAFSTILAAGRELPVPPPGAPGPFSLSDPARVSELLTGAGFAEPALQEIEEPMYFGPDPDTAEPFILGTLGWLVATLDEKSRERALDGLRRSLAAHHTEAGVTYRSTAWLITSHRVR